MRVLFFIVGMVCSSVSAAEALLIIASPDVPVTSISVRQLADIYSLKKVIWSNQKPIVPVSREAGSDAREKFAEAVFGLTAQELAELWNQLRFQGMQPPTNQVSDHAVLGFVRSVPGAIGYISASQQPTGTKVLLRLP
jgi:ABC-type phosphate transport system substrate-binding protein